MEERASSSAKIELYRAEVKVREVLNSVWPEVLKPSCIVPVQQISKSLGRLKLYNCVSFSLFKKGAQLIVPLLKLCNYVSRSSFASSLALVATLAYTLLLSFTTFILFSSRILVLSKSIACLDVAINLDIAYRNQNFVKYMSTLLAKDEMYIYKKN